MDPEAVVAAIDPAGGRRPRPRPRQHRQPDRQRGRRPASSSSTGSASNGFEPRKYALVEDRFNVAAWLHGTGGGYNLVFNAHLDTTLRPDAVWSARDARDPLYHSAWVEGDEIFGDGVVNDKGPMAAFLVAAKAIRAAGFPLGATSS